MKLLTGRRGLGDAWDITANTDLGYSGFNLDAGSGQHDIMPALYDPTQFNNSWPTAQSSPDISTNYWNAPSFDAFNPYDIAPGTGFNDSAPVWGSSNPIGGSNVGFNWNQATSLFGGLANIGTGIFGAIQAGDRQDQQIAYAQKQEQAKVDAVALAANRDYEMRKRVLDYQIGSGRTPTAYPSYMPQIAGVSGNMVLYAGIAVGAYLLWKASKRR